MQKEANILTGVFPNKKNAEKAFNCAIACGYSPQEINVIMSSESMKKILNNEEPSITQGGAVGGAVGGLIGVLAALGVNAVLPGIGFVIAGPLGGIVSGTLMGTLVSMGIAEMNAQEYEEKINKGATILTVEQRFKSDLEEQWRQLEK
ncbi:hypothetical protein [Legionella saoudiensis]|uniref:hypothetical protein n=1 Tax=Legionella saoudiensis TaxID=1750561 RepID=UPI000730BE20|nr:hypothetical protein [Legionella saoudiensis]